MVSAPMEEERAVVGRSEKKVAPSSRQLGNGQARQREELYSPPKIQRAIGSQSTYSVHVFLLIPTYTVKNMIVVPIYFAVVMQANVKRDHHHLPRQPLPKRDHHHLP